MDNVTAHMAAAALSHSQNGRLQQLNRQHNSQAIDKVAGQFEAVFLNEMLAPVVAQVRLPKPYGGGFSEEMYQSLLVDEYSKAMVKAGGIGIAKQIRSELLKLQEQETKL
jgi:flagellar protein FlgJ